METDESIQTIDEMITPMMLTDEAGTPAYVNSAFITQIGYPPEQMADNNSWFMKAFPDQDYRKKIRQSWDCALASGGPDRVTAKIYCADGISRWFDVHRHTVGSKYALTFVNVDTSVRQAEEFEEHLRQKDALLAIIAHDIRSPLTSIKQLAGAEDYLTLTETELREVFFRMNSQVDHIFNILNSLLMRTGGERGRFTEQRECIDLRDFFSKYQYYYQHRLSVQDICLVLELDEDAVLNYDPGILDIVCRNLLDNAMKCIHEKGIICISFKKTPTHAHLSIRDTGPGMSVKQIEQLTENSGSPQFYKNTANGFGLGLIMAKEMLEKYRGRLLIDSKMGVGTTFIIKITDHS